MAIDFEIPAEAKAIRDHRPALIVGICYVLQPYQMVKDLRTGVQTSDTSGVLDGDLDEFMAATLAQRAFGTPGADIEDVD